MIEREQLAALIVDVLGAEPHGLPLATIAKRLGMRREALRAVLRSDARFVRSGSTRGTRWQLVTSIPSHSAPFGPEQSDVLVDVLRRLDALEARVDALARTNGVRA